MVGINAIAAMGNDDDDYEEDNEGEMYDDGDDSGDGDSDEGSMDSDAGDEEVDEEEGEDEDGGSRSKFKPPTAEELEVLRDGAQSAELALFTMQVDETIKENTPDYASEKELESALHALKGILESLPEQKVDPAKEAPGFFTALGLSPPSSLAFKPPASVAVVGSYLPRMAALPAPAVDLAMEMSRDMFHEKDFLNYKYHGKRAVFLAVVARHLAKHKAFAAVEVMSLRGDPAKPYLSITPETASPTAFTIRLLPSLAPNAFPMAKLAPARNCVRGQAEGAAAAPTPVYNASVIEDMLLEEHTRVIHAAVGECAGLAGAAVLLRVWAAQRGFTAAPDAPGGFALSTLLVRLLQQGKVASYMNPPQILRVALGVLADPKAFSKTQALARDAAEGLPPPPEPKAFAAAAPSGATLVDASGWCNVLAGVSAAAMTETREAAKRTLAILQHPKDAAEAFHSALLTPTSFATHYDYHLHVSLPGGAGQGLGEGRDGCRWRREEAAVARTLAKGLGTRAQVVRALPRPIPPYTFRAGGGPAGGGELGPVRVGVLAQGEAAVRVVDMGPSSEDKVASKEFRAFWGDKAELRRFRDGSIAESVVWQVPAARRHQIPALLALHVAARHFPGSTSWATAAQLDGLLIEAGSAPGAGGGAAGAGQGPLQALDLLSKRVRGLNLALKVTSLQPLGAALYHAAVFPPAPHPLARAGGESAHMVSGEGNVPKCLDPIDAILHLEGSGRWPDDLEAIGKMKASLALQIAKSLADGFQVHSLPSEEHLDVLFEGYAFRLHVHTPQDEALQRKVELSGKKKGAGRFVGAAARLLSRARHAGAMQGVIAQHPSAGPTMRLAKRWVAAHMFSAHLNEEAIESLVAHAYTEPGPGLAPAGHIPAFLRFLSLLATHPWAARPLVADAGGDIPAGARSAQEARFQQLRAQGSKEHAMYLITPGDPASSGTAARPSGDVLARISSYARKSFRSLSRLVAGEGAPPGGHPAAAWLAPFQTPLDCYDVVLRLRRSALAAPGRALPLPGAKRGGGAAPSDPLARSVAAALADAPPPRKRARAAMGKMAAATLRRGEAHARGQLLVGFDPVGEFVKELEACYGHLAVFCYDGYGGSCVAAAWRPEAFLPAPVRVAAAHTSLQLPGAGGVSLPNVVQVVGEWARAGEGLVEDVECVAAVLGGKP